MTDLELIRESVAKHAAKILDANDRIWDYAELAFHEHKSAELLCRLLEEEGFTVQRGLAEIPTCFTGTYKKGTGKPVMGFLGEFDALSSLSQQAALPEKSPVTAGAPGHGCGHCALGTGSLAAAFALKDYLDATGEDGTVIYFGCPAEEGAGSKQFMARAGLFDDVDFVYTWHPSTINGVESVQSNAIMGANFRFKGRTSHAAASPHLGRSALDACELMNVGVNYLREHVIPEARIHYAYQDVGGAAPNVVQDHAQLKYFIRAPKITQVKEIGERVKDIARGAALMTGTEVDIYFSAGMCDYVPNDVLSEILSEALVAVGGPKFDDADRELAKKFFDLYTPSEIEAALKRLSYNYENWEDYRTIPLVEEVGPYKKTSAYGFGSTDVGDASYAAPTAQMNVATYANGTPGHSWNVTAQVNSSITHKALVTVAEALSLACILTIERPEAVKAAREEYIKSTGGKYICPVGMDAKPELEHV